MIVIQLPITSIHRVLIMQRDNITLQKRLSVTVTLSLIHCPGRLLQETFKNKQGPIDLKTSSKEVSIVLSIYCQSSQVFYVTKFSILRCGIRTHDLGSTRFLVGQQPASAITFHLHINIIYRCRRTSWGLCIRVIPTQVSKK